MSMVETAERAAAAGGIRCLVEELNREDSELRSRLLDAALVGLRVARKPDSKTFREDAAKIWAALEPSISGYLRAEGHVVPWAARYTHLPAEAVRSVRECHRRLGKLLASMKTTPFQSAPDCQAAKAGRELCALAVCIDDLIDDERRRIFPIVQKALFSAS
jgi:hypothetical protein